MIDRRRFLRTTLGAATGVAAGIAAGPLVSSAARAESLNAAVAESAALLPFVDWYHTNELPNTTAENNAAVVILSGMQRVWKTGSTWDSGVPVDHDLLRANVGYCALVTAKRTDAEAKQAFIVDRQHQSYSMIAGLGPLAELYRTGAKAVTGITSAPDGTPPTTISDTLPADAPPGSALGSGATDSALGLVAQLVNAVRGPHTSSNPSKYGYQYPRPWRLNPDSVVVDTGALDDLGYPVYETDVIVAPQLLRQRSKAPVDDAGFVSGHTNAVYLAGLAYAYAVPERFQELMAHAATEAHTRIVAGMHSPVDVIGGRILGTALAAATLSNPVNAELKAAARAQALEYFAAQTGTTDLWAYAHSSGLDTDPYADREANLRALTPRMTYILPREGRRREMVVPKGAEVLLETRQPYLSAAQRREVLRTTALPSGYVLLDSPELWGRLNLFAAADGYGAFDSAVDVTLDAALGGFHAADAWRNDIAGCGGLTKRGSGSLTLSGDNRYSGGTTIAAGTLVAGSRDALGRGNVHVGAGTLAVTAGTDGRPALVVGGALTLARESTLEVRLDPKHVPATGRTVQLIRAGRVRGTFGTVRVTVPGLRALPVYSSTGVAIRLFPA
ncbi:phosphatase PAP2 family protein [Phytohabitans aurantiacus]|jgi:autotransporter-associated beta strand protein|uniref:Phosphoesterase n=1 Tax=Phytohabitans aurantiacus TaxID=3016789 RepID=A0ABQ5R6V4_9ACTN|nr:phosphatase PAP2 family protein [Phytohabitans aurantiacus]GLI02489.1 phosphoesterase [Phytohabitans aurantiacus]